MNLKPYLTKARLPFEIAALCVAVLFVSWLAGQCRTWKKPKPTPAVVDPGTPTTGPSSQAPTINQSLIVARPDLTVDELREVAKKYGLRLTTLAPAASKPSGATSTPTDTERRQIGASADVLPQEPDGVVARTFPMLLAEESFKHAPSGLSLDVSAWLPGYGERVDLRAKFLEWVPPPVEQAKIPVCQTGSFIGNEAKWQKELGAGYVCSGNDCGLGGYGSVAYLGPRVGAVTFGARAFGAFSPQSGVVGVGGFSASW